MTTFIDPWQPSGRSTWPETSNGAEHGYLKLPGKTKMTKIRQTIYEDPGNPFQDELDAERAARGDVISGRKKTLPEAPDEVSPTGRSFFELDISDDPYQSETASNGGYGRNLSLDKLLPYEPSETSPTATSFRFGRVSNGSHYEPEVEPIRRPMQRSETLSQRMSYPPQSVRADRYRSMSFAIPSAQPPTSGECVSPRKSWHRENSLPLMKEQPEDGKGSPAPRSARDTRFYGFYEELMSAYDKRRTKMYNS